MSWFHPRPDLTGLTGLRWRIGVAARDFLFLHARQRRQRNQAPYDELRHALVQHVDDLGLHAPFTWQMYVVAVQNAYTSSYPNVVIEVVPTHLPQGTSAHWVVVSAQTPATNQAENNPQPYLSVQTTLGSVVSTDRQFVTMTASLLLGCGHDEAYIERVVYHEMGHLALGHLPTLPPVPRHLQVVWMSPASVMHEMNDAEAQHEHDAEQFATALVRLAHGWDPALLSAPRLNGFFDVLG